MKEANASEGTSSRIGHQSSRRKRPFPSPLESAADCLTGSIGTMIHLAWLSGDPRARAVASRWHTLAPDQRPRIEDLCRAAGISDGEFIGKVGATGWELSVDVARLIGKVWAESLKSAFGRRLMAGDELNLRGTPAEWKRRRNELLAKADRQACDRMARMRQKWGLSQRQFARLFMADIRTVKRWEAGEVTPTMRHQWFLRLFEKSKRRSNNRPRSAA